MENVYGTKKKLPYLKKPVFMIMIFDLCCIIVYQSKQKAAEKTGKC